MKKLVSVDRVIYCVARMMIFKTDIKAQRQKSAFLFILASILNSKFYEHRVEKTIPQGTLRGGYELTRHGRPYHVFYKIPYAKPPMGDLRFAAPEKDEGWPGVRDASFNDFTICTQQSIGPLDIEQLFLPAGSEDCLYLNVYTPLTNPFRKELLPVMFYIHGGAYQWGFGSMYQGNYLMDKDIVVVTFNYRLGVLGFLSNEDEIIPGNWGLKDQNLALRWVHDNIKYFGGNPDMVTLFGQSAGGASVHQHIISPMSRGLFKRAISNSGNAFNPWTLSLNGNARNNTHKLAEILQCPKTPSVKLLKCLRKKTTKDIFDQQIFFEKFYNDPLVIFKPVVESYMPRSQAFLPEVPSEAYKTGDVADVPWLTGINQADGAIRTPGLFLNPLQLRKYDQDFDYVAPISFYLNERTNDTLKVTEELRKFYFEDMPIDYTKVTEMTNLFTDGWFFAGMDHSLRLHLSLEMEAPVYVYYFDYRGTHSFSAIYGIGTEGINFGVTHTDDQLYLFPLLFIDPEIPYSLKDIRYSHYFVELWTNFVIYGDPTPPGHKFPLPKWTPLKSDALEYYEIGDIISMREDLLRDRRQLWRRLKVI